MKCKHCGHATIYKVRQANGRQCEQCGHKFAFEPKTDPYTIGDPLFDRAIQNVPSENTIFFTPRQLWHEVERRLRRRRLNKARGSFFWVAAASVAISGFISFIAESFIPLLIDLAVAALLVGAGVAARFIVGRRTPHPAMTYSTFRSFYLQEWVRTHGEMEKLAQSNGPPESPSPPNYPQIKQINLTTATDWELMKLPIRSQTARNIVEHRSKGKVFEKLEDLLEVPGIDESTLEALRFRLEELPSALAEQEKEPPQTPDEEHSPASLFESESELTKFSFDRALITDSAEIVDMLVANNFHFENNCAVLSVDGHPSDIFETVLTMLRRNPQLKVFALHNASVDGCALPLTLRQDRWFTEPAVTIIDPGLRPRHAIAMRLFTLTDRSQILSSEVREALTPEEAAWLERGHIAEIEVLRPARLVRAIYQGFGQAPQVEAGEEKREAEVWADTSPGWYYYGGHYGSDSFG